MSGSGFVGWAIRRAGWWAALAVALCGFAFFRPLATGNMYSTVPGFQNGLYPWAAAPNGIADSVQNDQAALSYGWDEFQSAAIRSGSMPFWDPHSFGGEPHFANGQTGVLDPVRLVTDLVTAPGWAHDLFSLTFLVAGGLGAYALARELALRRYGSMLTGVAWMLAAWNVAWLHLEVLSPLVGLVPFDVFFMVRAMRRSNRVWIGAAALCLALTFASVHVLFALITWYLVLGIGVAATLVAAVRRDRATATRRALRLGAVGAASIGLAAPVLIPTAQLLLHGARTRLSYTELRQHGLAAPSWFLTAIVPAHTPLGAPALNDRLAFAGTATIVLAVLALFSRRTTAWWISVVLCGTIFIVAIGTPATWLVFHLAPGMNVFRPYSRLMAWWPLGLALLGGLGLDRLHMLIARRSVRWAHVVALVIIAGTAAQLLRYGHEANPPFTRRTAQHLLPTTPLLDALRHDDRVAGGWPTRVIGLRVPAEKYYEPLMLDYTTAMATGVDTMSGYDSTMPRRTADVVRVLTGVPVKDVLAKPLHDAYAPAFSLYGARLDLLNAFGVSRLLLVPQLHFSDSWAGPLRALGARVRYQGSDGTLVDLPAAGPVVVGGTQVTPSGAAALEQLASGHFVRDASVMIEPDQRAHAPRTLPSQPGPSGVIRSSSRGNDSASLTIDASRASWLEIPESWDPGWSATVNGHPARVYRVDYEQRGILIPRGRVYVHLRYQPPGWDTGLWIALITAALLIAAWGQQSGALRWPRRSRRGRRTPTVESGGLDGAPHETGELDRAHIHASG